MWPGRPSAVRLYIYALTGQRLWTLVDTEHPPGRYEVTWDGNDERGRAVASGVHLCRMEVEHFIGMRKMMLVR